MSARRPARRPNRRSRHDPWFKPARVAPQLLLGLGLALVLFASVAVGMEAPVRQGDPQAASAQFRLTDLKGAAPYAPYAPYGPYACPYPYAPCGEADLEVQKESDPLQVTLDPLELFGAGGARPIAPAAIEPAQTEPDVISYELFVKNEGPDEANNVVLTDSLPPDVRVLDVTPNAPSVDCTVAEEGPDPSAVVECTTDLLEMGQFFEVLVQVEYTIPAELQLNAAVERAAATIKPAAVFETLTNVADVSSDEADPDPDNNTATAETKILTPGIDLEPVPLETSSYWMVARDGGVFAFGDAPFRGSMGGIRLNSPMVGIAGTPTGNGYWTVAADGGIFAFGDAAFHGSTGNLSLARPIIGMAVTGTGNGYWLFASDGGVFAFGDAAFHGSTGNISLAKPIVGMASTPSGNGYWLFASDGGVFAFGDAPFFGSLGAVSLNDPIAGGIATSDGAGNPTGYYMVASDGGIFAFGDAPFLGSMGNINLNKPIVGMAADTIDARQGYWLFASDGGVFNFGAVFRGSLGNISLAEPIVGGAARFVIPAG